MNIGPVWVTPPALRCLASAPSLLALPMSRVHDHTAMKCIMEVDYQSIDECKESDGGALLLLHQRSEVASSDLPLPMNDGQSHG